MAKVSPLMALPPLIFAAFAVLAFVGMYREDPEGLPSTRVGQPAPPITDAALEGYAGLAPDALSSGEVTLVNFWASWCPPCRVEHPQLLEYQAQGLRIVGVNIKDQAGNAAKYLAEEENPFIAVPFDPAGRTAIDWGVTAPPETFIVDGEGVVLHRFTGPLTGTEFETRFVPELDAALAQ
ncbi:Thiol:disulfide interchange protein CycY precursor [Roseivivax sp. THAF40]|uniref:DsbE family thiol:disulfide interchange protein n=2 Tax=unclassified Roseivivax TaxID=2639302 RepID=UPI0012A905C4|nr:DsbE family thiol:disulfide interchange protein [Roseivivax sp. THAF197b]QFS82718.1 Thiol:disulfide interchange protein CycY precursor [Roseivivax sp. THAF197b]QFT46487.1 Thiol:disulfide interchange protein CycY precursor [Roseivivax sp. THAF40]